MIFIDNFTNTYISDLMEVDCNEQDTLIEMSRLSAQIPSLSGWQAVNSLRRFVNLYINHQRLSQDFFMALCQHNILLKLFTSRTSTLEILEIFNLLLSNSNKQPQLVFIFSQNTFHEFFFQKISIQRQSSQTVEYYIQLLKTIILKISAKDNRSLIKLFCNNRYPHFPLLTTAAMIAIDAEQEELVRVTANQCVLLMLKLINQSKIGQEYLSELQMMVYYHEIVDSLLRAEEEQQIQLVKFMVDLLLSLKSNIVGRSILLNLLTNQLIFKNAAKPQIIIKFFMFFYDQMIENTLFPKEFAENVTLVFFRIIGKYYSENTINYTYFTAQRVLTQLVVPQRPKTQNLMRFYEERGKKLQQYLIRQTPMMEDQKCFEFILEQWLTFNHRNKQISPLKPTKSRSRNAFQQFFTSKQELVEEYLQSIMTLSGIQAQKIKSPIHNLSFSSNYQTSIFLVESICHRYQDRIDPTRAYEHYYRDQIWQLVINEDLLVQLYGLGSRVAKSQIQNAKQQRKMSSSRAERVKERTEKLFGVTSSCCFTQMQSQSQEELEKEERVTQLQGFSYFLAHMRPELTTMFSAALTIHQKKLSLPQLSLISAIAIKIRLSESVQPNHLNLLLTKLKELQVYITQDIFSEQNHHFVFKYISKNRERTLLRRVERGSKDHSQQNSPKKVFGHIKERIQKNFIHYEVIKRMISCSVVSLTEFMKQYWEAKFFIQKEGMAFPVTQFLVKDSNGVVLEVIADHNFQFCVKKSKIHHESVIFCIARQDCNFDKNNPTYLSFDDHKFLIDLQTEQKANHFRQDLRKLRNQRKQIIMNGILEYLGLSYESLAVSATLRNHHQNQNSKDPFRTPK